MSKLKRRTHRRCRPWAGGRSPSGITASGTALLLLGSLAVSSGCGDGLAKVTGRVSLDGQPLRGGGNVRAMVYLYPEDGSGAPAVGLVDEDGQYRVSTGTKNGVEPGAYLVSISGSELIGEEVVGVPRSGRRITPARYADPRESGLRVEVSPGSNTFDFDLESTPGDAGSRRSAAR